MSQPGPSRRKPLGHGRLALICAGVAVLMVGAAFASVPLYRAFCQATGFDGTVRKAKAAPGQALDRTIRVSFDTNVRDLPWSFTPEVKSQTIRIGATGMAYFKVTNNSDHAITGRATYNVVPETAGYYFQKLQCFCFNDQTLQPRQTLEFPMIYFVAPEFASDRETRGFTDITLSYTFFPTASEKAQARTIKSAAEGGGLALGAKARGGL